MDVARFAIFADDEGDSDRSVYVGQSRFFGILGIDFADEFWRCDAVADAVNLLAEGDCANEDEGGWQPHFHRIAGIEGEGRRGTCAVLNAVRGPENWSVSG